MVTENFSKTRIKGSMLQVNHIRLSYGPRLVLDDVSFTVAPGEKAGLIGVNGAGKSSLLKIIAGLLDADGGTVMLPRTYGYLSQDVAHEDPVAGEVIATQAARTGAEQASAAINMMRTRRGLIARSTDGADVSQATRAAGTNFLVDFSRRENIWRWLLMNWP